MLEDSITDRLIRSSSDDGVGVVGRRSGFPDAPRELVESLSWAVKCGCRWRRISSISALECAARTWCVKHTTRERPIAGRRVHGSPDVLQNRLYQLQFLDFVKPIIDRLCPSRESSAQGAAPSGEGWMQAARWALCCMPGYIQSLLQQQVCVCVDWFSGSFGKRLRNCQDDSQVMWLLSLDFGLCMMAVTPLPCVRWLGDIISDAVFVGDAISEVDRTSLSSRILWFVAGDYSDNEGGSQPGGGRGPTVVVAVDDAGIRRDDAGALRVGVRQGSVVFRREGRCCGHRCGAAIVDGDRALGFQLSESFRGIRHGFKGCRSVRLDGDAASVWAWRCQPRLRRGHLRSGRSGNLWMMELQQQCNPVVQRPQRLCQELNCLDPATLIQLMKNAASILKKSEAMAAGLCVGNAADGSLLVCHCHECWRIRDRVPEERSAVYCLTGRWTQRFLHNRCRNLHGLCGCIRSGVVGSIHFGTPSATFQNAQCKDSLRNARQFYERSDIHSLHRHRVRGATLWSRNIAHLRRLCIHHRVPSTEENPTSSYL